jgi:hypothetical protein
MVVFTVGLTTAAIWPQGSDKTVITVIMMIIIYSDNDDHYLPGHQYRCSLVTGFQIVQPLQ